MRRLNVRSVKINVRKRTDPQIRKEYIALVHSLAFRVTGEAFAALPTVAEVIIAAYSQRADKATGHVDDEYLLSARIQRSDWHALNWTSIDTIDPIAAFARFELIRNMTSTGIIRPITPHSPAHA